MKIFSKYLNRILISNRFPSQRYIMLLQPFSNERFSIKCFAISRLFRIFQIYIKTSYYLTFRIFRIVLQFPDCSQFPDYFPFFQKISQFPKDSANSSLPCEIPFANTILRSQNFCLVSLCEWTNIRGTDVSSSEWRVSTWTESWPKSTAFRNIACIDKPGTV